MKRAARIVANDDDPQEAEPPWVEPLCRLAFPIVYRTLRFAGIERQQDREDLGQDIVLAIVQHYNPEAPPPKLKAWIARFAYNIAFNDRRRARNRLVTLTADVDIIMTDKSPNPEQALSLAQRDRLLHRLIDRIPEKRRIVLLMREFHDIEIEAIAEELGIAEKTVRNRWTQARAELAEAIERMNSEEREVLGCGLIGFGPLTAEQMGSFFAEQRAAYEGEPIDAIQERVLSRVRERISENGLPTDGPPSGPRVKAPSRRILERLSNVDALALGVAIFVAGFFARTLFDHISTPTPPERDTAITVAPDRFIVAPTAAPLPTTAPTPKATATADLRANARTQAPPSAPAKGAADALTPEEIEAFGVVSARKALRSNKPREALSTLRKLDEQVPTGKLIAERRMLAKEARAALGQ